MIPSTLHLAALSALAVARPSTAPVFLAGGPKSARNSSSSSAFTCDGGGSGASLPDCIGRCIGESGFERCREGCVVGCTRPAKVLFIGNSLTYWNDGTDIHVKALAKAAGFTVEVAERTIGGATLGTLYRNSGRNSPRSMIASGDYDVVVMQEDMPELSPQRVPAGFEPFYEYARLFADDIRAVGATPVFYMTWAFPRLSWINQVEISFAHRRMLDEIGVNSCPAGNSFDLAERTHPGRWEFLGRDREHQSWYGSYIAASAIYSQLFGESPEGLHYIPPGSGISQTDATELQRLAWMASQDWNTATRQSRTD